MVRGRRVTTGCEFQTGGTGTTDGMEPDAPDAPPDAPPDAVPPTVAHGWRSRVVPSPTAAHPVSTSTSTPPTSSAMRLARRLDWAALLRRVFGDEVTQCPRCGDVLCVLAFITDPRVTAHILEHLGLTCDAVPIAPARAPPDDPVSELDFGS